MQSVCKTCRKDFEIRKEDQVFYEQMSAPLPHYCPDCRMARRLSFRNERTLYKRACDLCKKESISLYPKGTTFPTYCHDCWWSDKWDPKDYAMDYDQSRPFLEQFGELIGKVPRIMLNVIGNNVRSDYTNNSGENKDCYLIFAAEYNEDCMYGRLVQHCKACVDCAFIYDSEKCYECIDGRKLYNCMFTEQCQSSTDLYFSYNCRDSTNAIFCTNGRHISYQIENKPCTKEEFEAKKAEIFSSHESLEEAKKKFEMLKSESIVKFAVQTKCHDVAGSYLFNCFEGTRVFDTTSSKNCSYMADTVEPIDSMDCNNAYYKIERCYDMMGILECNRSKHCTYVFWCHNIEYSDSCYNSGDLFGCCAIKKGNNMILNKVYEKEEYTALRAKIIEEMKKSGDYGQSIPPKYSPHGYNECLAKEYFPLTRDEALARGYKWQEESTGTYDKGTLPNKAMPASIKDTDDGILNEILECETCRKNYRLTQAELAFYRQMGIPIPRKDFECRHQARMGKRTPRKLWSRGCMCNNESHDHESKCGLPFETPYSPDRKETIYCEECFNREIL